MVQAAASQPPPVVDTSTPESRLRDFCAAGGHSSQCPSQEITPKAESSVKRISPGVYQVVVGKGEDWYDTGIPVIIDQIVEVTDVQKTGSTYSVKLSGNAREAVGTSNFSIQSMSDPGFPTYPSTFLETVKLKILSSVPVINFRVEVRETPSAHCADPFWGPNYSQCQGYAGNRDAAKSRATELISAIKFM